jgi:hypothetical protein
MDNEINLNPAPAPRTFHCPECRHTLSYPATLKPEYAGCPKCHNLFAFTANGYNRTQQFDTTWKPPCIPLDSKALIDGVQWTVTGYMLREEKKEDFIWREFLLTGRNGEIAFLAESMGHWTFNRPYTLTLQDSLGKNDDPYIDADGTQFRLFHKYFAKYVYLEGVFNWDVNAKNATYCADYVASPRIFISEKQDGDESYFIGRHIGQKEIFKAFGQKFDLPSRVGTGAAQPLAWGIEPLQFTKFGAVLCFIILAMQVWQNPKHYNKAIYSTDLTVYDSTIGKPIVSESFELPGTRSQLMEVAVYAPVENKWAEAELLMVNEKTGEETTVSTGVEYYRGVEGGESWSEGNQRTTTTLCSVEPGRYHFTITPFAEAATTAADAMVMNVKVTWDIVSWWNTIWALILVVGTIIIVYWYEYSFEKKRWYNSNYSPYQYDDE